MNSGSYVLNATRARKSVWDVSCRCMPTSVWSWIRCIPAISRQLSASRFHYRRYHLRRAASGNSGIHGVPEPVIELAIEPKTKAGQGKLGEALAKLAEEDPTFRAHTNQETGQTIIAGMGELHLEIIVDRLLREFHVEANVGAPQVAYKETITKAVMWTASMRNSPADVDSTDTVKLNLSRWMPMLRRPTCLNPPLSAALFRRNISRQSAKVSRMQ